MNSDGKKEKITLRLFIVPNSEYCMVAVNDIEEFVEKAKGQYEVRLEVVDIMENAQAAEDEDIIVTPTLIKKHPVPETRLVGSFKRLAELLNVKTILIGLIFYPVVGITLLNGMAMLTDVFTKSF